MLDEDYTDRSSCTRSRSEEDKADVLSGCDCNTLMSSITNKTRRNWSDLQPELLELILRRLAVADIARFKVVCSFWNATAKSYTSCPVYKPLRPQTPWLLLPRERKDFYTGRFFSLTEKKVYTFRNLFQGLISEDENFWLGSSHGWLLIMSDSKTRKSVQLLNPISMVRIILPPLEFKVQRVFLSSDPSCSKTFIVVGIPYVQERRCTTLAFYKHGDDGNNTTWAYLDNNAQREFLDNFIFHKNHLYILCSILKSISVWDCGGAYPIKTIDFQLPERELGGARMCSHLVESIGEILLVEKVFFTKEEEVGYYINYKIHKLNITPNKVECLKVECLEERAIVLSECRLSSMSLSTLDFPELEANSIYVAQPPHPESAHITGGDLVARVDAYNLKRQGFKTYYTSQLAELANEPFLPRQLWIVPNPCLA